MKPAGALLASIDKIDKENLFLHISFVYSFLQRYVSYKYMYSDLLQCFLYSMARLVTKVTLQRPHNMWCFNSM